MRAKLLFCLTYIAVTPLLGDYTQAGDVCSNRILLVNNILSIVCNGNGPSEDIAERLAISQCIVRASDRINGSFHVQTLSVETERDAAYHQEVSADRKINGLACEIQEETITENDSTYNATVKCKFDLKNVKIVDSTLEKVTQDIKSTTRRVILTTVPSCDTVLIRGESPRIVQCDSNPKQLLVYKTDREMIIRSGKLRPKHIQINEMGDNLNVYLEK